MHVAADMAKVSSNPRLSERVSQLLSNMHLHEKIGQLCQVSGCEGHVSEHLAQQVRDGWVGSVINEVDGPTVNYLQHIAKQESRLGIPLLIGRDVIHGFKTIFPIPLGQAASWNAELVEQAARIAALEANSVGVNWTFAPMIDISRDPRWGRIAESLGEDPYLCSILGAAMVDGFQGTDMSESGQIAACAKHFAGYGATESGRDYGTTNIPENELRNIYLPPFKMASDSGAATFMSSFSDLNGVPASGNRWLMKKILREEWGFKGFVVSDWESIYQLEIHGLTENSRDSAQKAFNAGLDMEMVSTTYREHLEELLETKQVDIAQVDHSVGLILSVKEQLGLFDKDCQSPDTADAFYQQESLDVAKQIATQSCVLLKNHNQTLPINAQETQHIALIGPLADDGFEQLGTWIFDGEPQHSVTIRSALESACPSSVNITYDRAMATTRSYTTDLYSQALASANQADVIVMCVGEEAILSGEAHCRADIDLPGSQMELIEKMAELGKPIVLVVLAGRPLTLEPIIEKVDSVLYAWHPGTMAGPAIADLLLGEAVPSGKLPVTFPRKVGQIPLYYNQKNSGKPATNDQYIHMNDIPPRSPQTSLGMAAIHLDTHFSPLFEFGFGLSYSQFTYSQLMLSQHHISRSETLEVAVTVHNTGDWDADEVVQLYIRDLVASATRPVKELKQFSRVHVKRGEHKKVIFSLNINDLSFYNDEMQWTAETGHFHLWVGGSSATTLQQGFELING